MTRLTNLVLLAALAALTLTGVYGLFWTRSGWLWDVHRYAGWLLVVALPWKTVIVIRSLRRRLRLKGPARLAVWASLFLTALVLFVLTLGVLWNWRLGPSEYPLRQTAISWHWMLALGLLAPLLIHLWQRWNRPSTIDLLSRRAVVRWGVLALAGLATWQAAERAARLRRTAEQVPRPSGSRPAKHFSGNDFPITHTRAPGEEQTGVDRWRLVVSGAVARPGEYRYDDLLALPAAQGDAALDCTLGWYSIQNWSGLTLAGLLDTTGASPDALGVRLTSVTGYQKILPIAEARLVLLATHVGGEVLSHLHGFPLRAVVPTRRGWYWVKWLCEVEVLTLLSADEVSAG